MSDENQDDMADAWADALDEQGVPEDEAAATAAMEAASAPSDESNPDEDDEHTLNQDEIDSLLGFGAAGDNDDNNIGISALIERALNTYEKLPMLEVVFDRFVRMMSGSFRNVTSDNVDVSIDSITSLRFGDYLNAVPIPSLLMIFKAIEWENFGLVTMDSALTFSFVDVLMGGRRYARPLRIEGRSYTTIEQNIVKRLGEQILVDMGTAFDPISPVTFEHERMETNPRFATITRPSSAAILIRLRVDMDERGGNIEIVLPYATLEPVKELLLQMFMGEKFGKDSSWEYHLGRELQQTDVELEAILAKKQVSLDDLLNFKVGNTILLDRDADSPVTLSSGGVPVIVGKIGQHGKSVAVSVDEVINQNKSEL